MTSQKKFKRNLSIIIPCYNVEKFIVKCLDSLIVQLKNYNYEIILVDDNSIDKTYEIIKKYGNKNNNILILHNKENCGAGVSRNKALKVAKYDYISFIDSDDFIDNNFYDCMFDELENTKADLVACDINMVFEDGSSDILSKACFFVPSKYNLIDTGLAASPCNKIIKKDLLLKYPFAEGIMNEDVACILSVIANCKKVAYTEKTKYNYVQHKNSVQNSRLSLKRLDAIKSFKIFESRIRGNKEYDDFIAAVLFQQIICLLLYVPVKEKNYFRRAVFLTKFGKDIKGIDIIRNRFYWKFTEGLTPRAKLYYKTVVKLTCTGHGYLASLVMSFYRFYSKYKNKKNVIEKSINIKKLENCAKKNQRKRDKLKISVIVPNYNYEKFLLERIYSILSQNYKIYELIILDDCSTDNSRILIDKIVKELSPFINIKKDYNVKNSGSTFKQWKKAFEMAEGEYVWIAEADDYCDKKMLSSIMKMMEKDKEIKIGYVDTAFINKEGYKILKTIKPEIDIMKTGHWDKNFINDGKEEIKNYAYLNCTIANVSSVVFKNENYSEIFDELQNYKQVGDYLFYLTVMEKGKIAFVNKPLNFYRVHGNNVTSTTKKQLHFDELQKVHKLLDKKIHFTKEQKQMIEERYEFLKKVWELDKK